MCKINKRPCPKYSVFNSKLNLNITYKTNPWCYKTAERALAGWISRVFFNRYEISAQKITLCFFISCLSLFQSKYKELSLSTTSSKFCKKWNRSLIVKGKVLIKCTRWYKQNYTITVPIICTHKQTCSWLRHWNKESENSRKRPMISVILRIIYWKRGITLT